MEVSPTTLDLRGRRALVTGASRGIGRSIALSLAQAGASLALTSRDKISLDPLLQEVQQQGGTALALECDVTDRLSVREMASRLSEHWMALEILVNNAGQAASEKFENHSNELWDGMLAVNLTGVFNVTRAVLPLIQKGKERRIINIASIAAKVGAKYVAAYTASKHGVLGLTRALAIELVGQEITVNAVCPGYVDTPMTDSAVENIVDRTGMSPKEARQILASSSPQKRLIDPAEIAALVVWLAGGQSRGITGQAINVDGGTVMW